MRLAICAAAVLFGATLSVPAIAAPAPGVWQATQSMIDVLMAPPKPEDMAKPAQFGEAAAACAATIAPDRLDLTALPGLGWNAIALQGSGSEKYFAFERTDNPIRLYLSTEIASKGQCVVDGLAASTRQFGSIADEVKKQVGAKLGKKLSNTGSTSDPRGYSQGAGFRSDDLMTIVSSERRGESMSLRITVMRIDPAMSAIQLANAAGMAAEFLPISIQGLIKKQGEQPAPAANPQP